MRPIEGPCTRDAASCSRTRRAASCTFVIPGLLALAIAGCDWSEIVLLPPEGGGVARPGLLVEVRLEPEHEALAAALGWPGGTVPGALVAVAPRGAELEWEETEADTGGVASFPRLLPGRYSVTAFRTLTEAEQALLSDAGLDARVLAGGGILRAPGIGEDPDPLHVRPDEPGSLVISELSFVAAQVEGGTYLYGFIELYNAADTVIYLDGKIIGEGSVHGADFPNFPCSEWEHVRNIPGGLAARDMQAFPGSGHDHPLAPGEVVVVTTQAIDHSQFGDHLPDLTGADFEFSDPGGLAQNPHVPKMVNVGPRWRPRGMHFVMNHTVPFVLEAVDVTTLPLRHTPQGAELRSIPGELVLDVFASRLKWISELAAPCDQLVHRDFERMEAVLVPAGWSDGRSLQRKVIGTGDDGRQILQRTRTSMLDLFFAQWTPRSLPSQ